MRAAVAEEVLAADIPAQEHPHYTTRCDQRTTAGLSGWARLLVRRGRGDLCRYHWVSSRWRGAFGGFLEVEPVSRPSAEEDRIRLEYRRLILLGKLRLPLEEARKLVGPDCAYHLYFTRHDRTAAASRRRGSGRRKRRRT